MSQSEWNCLSVPSALSPRHLVFMMIIRTTILSLPFSNIATCCLFSISSFLIVPYCYVCAVLLCFVFVCKSILPLSFEVGYTAGTTPSMKPSFAKRTKIKKMPMKPVDSPKELNTIKTFSNSSLIMGLLKFTIIFGNSNNVLDKYNAKTVIKEL